MDGECAGDVQINIDFFCSSLLLTIGMIWMAIWVDNLLGWSLAPEFKVYLYFTCAALPRLLGTT